MEEDWECVDHPTADVHMEQLKIRDDRIDDLTRLLSDLDTKLRDAKDELVVKELEIQAKEKKNQKWVHFSEGIDDNTEQLNN